MSCFRSRATTSIVRTSIGRICLMSCVPLRASDICGPSMCNPTMPASPLAAIAALAAWSKMSGWSVITVGITPTVPNWRCAAAIVAMPSRVGVAFTIRPPPPFTCKSTKPGVRHPGIACAVLGACAISTTCPPIIRTAYPDKTLCPSNSCSGAIHTSVMPHPYRNRWATRPSGLGLMPHRAGRYRAAHQASLRVCQAA